MSAYFFDSSGLAKRYLIEPGSTWVIRIFKPSAKNTIFVARIAGVEVVSAIARRRKGLAITPANSKKAISRFQRYFRK